MELEQYRTRLEQMVEEKSKDLIAIQENLEPAAGIIYQGTANSAIGTGYTYCYEYGTGRNWPLHWCRPFGDMGKPS